MKTITLKDLLPVSTRRELLGIVQGDFQQLGHTVFARPGLVSVGARILEILLFTIKIVQSALLVMFVGVLAILWKGIELFRLLRR